MNYNEMSAAQCADWLEAKDWIKSVVDGFTTWTRKCPPEVAASPHNFRRTHPYPLTLDGAAGAMKRPWRLVRVEVNHDGRAMATIYNGAECKWNHAEGPDEMTARYRAAVAARMEDEHEQSR